MIEIHYLSILSCFLLILSAPALISGGELGDGFTQIFQDDFNADKLRPQDWSPSLWGTGTITIRDGYLFLNISNRTTRFDTNSVVVFTNKNTRYGCLEIRLRCGDDNKLESKIGGGWRHWGFAESWDNYLNFQILSPEAEPEWVGFWGAHRENTGPMHWEPISGIDVTQWHNYTIIWKPGNTTFLVDSEVVAVTEVNPTKDMGLGIEISNGVLIKHIGNTPYEIKRLDIPYNLYIQIDYVKLFRIPEPILLSILVLLLPVPFVKRIVL